MIETAWQTELCKLFRSQGYYARKWASQWQKGVPDIIAVGCNQVYFFEVKRIVVKDLANFDKKLAVTPKQKVELTDLAKRCSHVYVLIIVEKDGGRKDDTLFGCNVVSEGIMDRASFDSGDFVWSANWEELKNSEDAVWDIITG